MKNYWKVVPVVKKGKSTKAFLEYAAQLQKQLNKLLEDGYQLQRQEMHLQGTLIYAYKDPLQQAMEDSKERVAALIFGGPPPAQEEHPRIAISEELASFIDGTLEALSKHPEKNDEDELKDIKALADAYFTKMNHAELTTHLQECKEVVKHHIKHHSTSDEGKKLINRLRRIAAAIEDRAKTQLC